MVVVRVVAIITCALIFFWALYMLRSIILLLVLSIFFCYLIAPLVRLFEQPVYLAGRAFKLPRGVSIGVVYLVFGAVVFVAALMILPVLQVQANELAGNLPNYLTSGSESVKKTFTSADSWLRHLELPDAWREEIFGQITRAAEELFPWLSGQVRGLLGYLAYLPWLIIVPIMSFFLLKDAESFEHSLLAFFPDERLQKRVHYLLLDVSGTIAAYIRAQITACLVIGAEVTVGLGLIGVPYAVVLGAIAGVLEFVPLVGPLLAAIIIFSLTLTASFKLALWSVLFLAVLRIVHDYIVYPRIIGHGIKMHPLIVVLAVLSGAEIAGLTGIFLAIPFVGLIVVTYNHYLAYRGIRSLRKPEDATQQVLDLEPDITPTGAQSAVLESNPQK